jgi:bacterioferritin (cytochrome b1)
MQPGLLRIASRVAAADQEGALGAADGQIIAHLGKILTAKYAIESSYRSFADRVKGPWRDALVEHWHEHAGDERKSAYAFAMKIVGLGGDPIQTAVMIPACVPDVGALVKVLADQELAAIAACRELVQLAGDNTSLRLLAEETILLDTHHLDDLRRMSGSSGR